jgi:thiamine biosynthesis lipoprotein
MTDLEYHRSFHSMGSTIRIVVGAPERSGLPAPDEAADREQRYIEAFARRLSRFVPDSELSALNGDPREEVPCSGLLRAAVRAGLWAAETTDGLVDSTLNEALEAVGYDHSMVGVQPIGLPDALAIAPPRRPARPDPRRMWSRFEVDDRAGVVRRPPGLKFDTGGTGKGLAADAVAVHLAGHRRFAIDCGGDLCVGGADPDRAPYHVQVEHPVARRPVATLALASGAVATSGLSVRIWRRADGTIAHHLLDPSTGQPAWTGLIGVTALAPTALEAETISKAALLLGPEGARSWLSRHGGFVFHESGELEQVGELPLRSTVKVRVPERSAAGSAR